MTNATKTIKVSAKRYEDHDDCLAAAAADYVATHPEARGYDLGARWEDDERDAILLDVPSRSVTLYVTNDTTTLGDAATHADLDTWGANVATEIESRFGVNVVRLTGAETRCDDPEINRWLREISSTDEWMQYL